MAIIGSSIYSALPRDYGESPIDITYDDDFTLTVAENMDVTVSIPDVTITSRLPQEIRDTCIDIYLGNSHAKLALGRYSIGTLPPGTSTVIEGEQFRVSMVTICASIPEYSVDGKIKLDVFADIGLKYAECLGMDLIDINIGIVVDASETAQADVDPPVVDGTNVEFKIITSQSSALGTIIEKFHRTTGGRAEASCGCVDISVTSSTEGDYEADVSITSDPDKMPYDVFRSMLDRDGELRFHYSYGEKEGTIVIDHDEAVTLIKALEDIYTKGCLIIELRRSCAHR